MNRSIDAMMGPNAHFPGPPLPIIQGRQVN